MRTTRLTRSLLFALIVALGACSPATTETDTPDYGAGAKLYTGGTIYTGITSQPIVSSVVVSADGHILATFGEGDPAPVDLETIELGGAVMYPGFVDAHAHLLGIGQRELTLNLDQVASVAEMVEVIRTEAIDAPEGQVIYGRGWIETDYPEARMPMASDLDPASPDHPVLLIRADGHALVANTAALVAAGITDETEDPDGGAIERDADGAATGILIDNAMGFVTGLLDAPTEAAVRKGYMVGSEVYAARGWTGVHNMSVAPDHLPIMQALDEAGSMPIRVYNALDEDGMDLAADHAYETDTIRNRAVKLYMDGALGSRGALLLKPYSDRPGIVGLSLLEPGRLSELMQTASTENVQLAIHAIGDLANRRIMDVYAEGAFDGDERWRIEHTQILDPADVQRIADLGLIASMQPSHAIGDLKFAPSRLGMGRLQGAYAWRSLLDSGAVIAGGSDAPVEVGSPLIEFYAAVARKDLEGFTGEGWHPEQAVTREEALKLFTLAPAYAAFQEDELGTIEVGKLADFTVFDRDLMRVPEAEILNANAVMTVVGGEIVYDARTPGSE